MKKATSALVALLLVVTASLYCADKKIAKAKKAPLYTSPLFDDDKDTLDEQYLHYPLLPAEKIDEEEADLFMPCVGRFLKDDPVDTYLLPELWSLVSQYLGDWRCANRLTFENIDRVRQFSDKLSLIIHETKGISRALFYDTEHQKFLFALGTLQEQVVDILVVPGKRTSYVTRDKSRMADGKANRPTTRVMRIVTVSHEGKPTTIQVPICAPIVYWRYDNDPEFFWTVNIWDNAQRWDKSGIKCAEIPDARNVMSFGNKTIIVGEHEVRFYEDNNFSNPTRTFGHKDVTRVVFTEKGLVTAENNDAAPCLWDTQTGNPIAQLRDLQTAININTLRIVSDKVVALNNEGTLGVWDVKDGKYQGETQLVSRVYPDDLAPNDTKIALFDTVPCTNMILLGHKRGSNTKVKLFDLDTRKFIAVLKHRFPIDSAAADSASMIVTASKGSAHYSAGKKTDLCIWKQLEL